MTDTRSLSAIAWDDLFSEVCICGQKKQKRQSFCRSCYFELPQNLRMNLYKSMSDGYAEVYDEAKDYLKNETNRLKK